MGKTAELFDLTGKSVIVTGSGRGLGRAIARGLAEAGARVAVSGRTAEIVRETAAELRADGHEVIDVVFDAQRPDDVARLIDTTVEAFGGLDVMVVNHGIGGAGKAEEIEAETWDEMLSINLTSAFSCAQFAGRRMIAQGGGGSIIFTSSTSSLVVFEGLTSYGAAKAGLDHTARHLAVEWGPHNIRVNSVAPGYMTAHMRGSEGRYEDPEELARVLALTPLGRKGEPEELVGPIVFLASDASSYVTGHVIPVDGGWCLS
jgi:NAD(P)-dependent dehydrogenase (short-subunit alcohol dehydrogenase family)